MLPVPRLASFWLINQSDRGFGLDGVKCTWRCLWSTGRGVVAPPAPVPLCGHHLSLHLIVVSSPQVFLQQLR